MNPINPNYFINPINSNSVNTNSFTNSINPMSLFNTTNSINPINSTSLINPINPINSINPINPINSINSTSSINPINPISSTNSINPLFSMDSIDKNKLTKKIYLKSTKGNFLYIKPQLVISIESFINLYDYEYLNNNDNIFIDEGAKIFGFFESCVQMLNDKSMVAFVKFFMKGYIDPKTKTYIKFDGCSNEIIANVECINDNDLAILPYFYVDKNGKVNYNSSIHLNSQYRENNNNLFCKINVEEIQIIPQFYFIK